MKDFTLTHDRNAMHDKRIAEMRAIYHMEGYGVYWGIVEALSNEPNLSIELTERRIAALAQTMIPSFNMMRYIKDCIEIGLFESDGNQFWSRSLKRRLSGTMAKSENARKAARARWEKYYAQGKGEEPKPVQPQLVDQGWKAVVAAYEREIGMLPLGTSLEKLESYCDDLGADAMVYAIEYVNGKNLSAPYNYLMKVLEAFVREGVDSRSAAEACTRAFEARKAKAREYTQAAQKTPEKQSKDEPRWL